MTATFGAIAGLAPGVTYEFTVVAGNAEGRSDAAGPVVVYPCEDESARKAGKRMSLSAATALDLINSDAHLRESL